LVKQTLDNLKNTLKTRIIKFNIVFIRGAGLCVCPVYYYLNDLRVTGGSFMIRQ